MSSKESTELPFYSFDRSLWPIGVLTFYRNPEDWTELRDFLEACRTDMYRPDAGRFYLLVDPRGLSILSPTSLHRVVTFMKEVEPLTKQYIVEIGIYVPSTPVRYIVDWIRWAKQPAVPWTILATEEETEAWRKEISDTLSG